MPDSTSCIKIPIHQEKLIVLTILTQSRRSKNHPGLSFSFLFLSFLKWPPNIMWLSGACQILAGWAPSLDDRRSARWWLPLTLMGGYYDPI